MHGIGHGTDLFFVQASKKCWHIASFIFGKFAYCNWIKGVHTSINVALCNWFFFKANNFNTISLNYSKWVLPLMYSHGHGGSRCVPDMKVKQLAVANVGYNVTIGDYKRRGG